MTAGIPDQVVRYVQSNLTSIEELEMLVLLQSRPDATWTIDGLARDLGSTRESITRRLTGFIALRVVEARADAAGQRFAYAPAGADLAALLREVVQTYRERRIAMTTLIYERPATPLRSFADAFRLRKDDPT